MTVRFNLLHKEHILTVCYLVMVQYGYFSLRFLTFKPLINACNNRNLRKKKYIETY